MDAPLLLAGETTKSVILRALAEQWPLSVKELYSGIRRSSARPLTYQAVYKSVKELLGDGVLAKQGNEYLISPAWVEKSGEFVGRLAESYEKSNLGSVRKIQELNFNSWSDAWNFLLSKINTNFFGESGEAYVQLRRFFLMPISPGDIKALKEFVSKRKVYVMCRANSVIDKVAANFFRSLGAIAVTGVECARPTNVLVYGDCVISFYTLGEGERAKLTEYYKATKDMKLPDASVFKSFSQLFQKRIKVKLIINRDPGVLSDVLEQTRAILSKQPY